MFLTVCKSLVSVKNSTCGSTGTEAMALNRDVQTEVDRITKIIKDMSASITTATQDVVERVKALEVTNTAQ